MNVFRRFRRDGQVAALPKYPQRLEAGALRAIAGLGAAFVFIGVALWCPPIIQAAAQEHGDSLSVEGLTEIEQRQVEAIIRNYLIANPEIIRDAINELQRKEEELALQARARAISDSAQALFKSERSAVLGNPEGDVTLVEFFDYNCTYCRRAHTDMKALIANDPNLRLVLKEFPILGDGSVQAARVSIAVLAAAPTKYAEFQDALMSEPGQVDGQRALAVAGELGLDVADLEARMEREEVTATIEESIALSGNLNLTGTPSYVTSQEVVVGAVGYEALKLAIEKARAACRNKSPVC